MSLSVLQKGIPQITDRFSMSQFFTKVYTTRSKRPSLKAVILHSTISPEQLISIISKRNDLDNYFFNMSKLDNELYRIELQRTLNDITRKGILLLDTSQSRAWVIFTTKNTYFVNHVIEPFIEKIYPLVSRIYFNLEQMYHFVDKIKNEYEGKSIFTGFTIKRNKKKWKLSNDNISGGTMTLWESHSDEELEKLSINYYLKIVRISFIISDENNLELLRADIKRNGKCSLSYGDFNSFYSNVILKIIEHGRTWHSFYSQRERKIINNIVNLNPFSINYSENILYQDIQKVEQVINNKYMCSITHNGNPYFVANVSDYQEGSSFGITILGNKVTITPIIRGAAESAWKLTENIQQVLGDGIINTVDVF